MGSNNSTLTNTFNTDWENYINTYQFPNPNGGDPLKGGAAILAAQNELNKFSWQNQLLVPGIQAAAQLILLNKQKQDFDDISQDQKNSISAAVNNYVSCIDALLPQFANAFPDIPKCAQYVPVDVCDEQLQTILCNLRNARHSDRYIQELNRQHQQNSLIRAKFIVPMFEANTQLQAIQINDLLKGKLPMDEVIEVLTDTAEQACLTGRIGNVCKTTLRDLGISRLRAQALGRQELRQQMEMFNRDIAPVSQLVDAQSMMLSPQYRIGIALQQATDIQMSLQNCYNRDAQKPPHLFAELQAKMQRCVAKLTYEASKANMVNTFVPNYQAILNPFISGLASGVGSMFQGGYNTQQGAVQSQWQSMPFGMPVGSAGSVGIDQYQIQNK